MVLRPTVDVQKHSDKHVSCVSAHFRVFKTLGIAFTKYLPKLLEEGLIKVRVVITRISFSDFQDLTVEVLEGELTAIESGVIVFRRIKSVGTSSLSTLTRRLKLIII